MDDHDRELQRAFDRQAARFEAAPVQSDPLALARLDHAALPAGARARGPSLTGRIDPQGPRA
jgi:hypothetical protein